MVGATGGGGECAGRMVQEQGAWPVLSTGRRSGIYFIEVLDVK